MAAIASAIRKAAEAARRAYSVPNCTIDRANDWYSKESETESRHMIIGIRNTMAVRSAIFLLSRTRLFGGSDQYVCWHRNFFPPNSAAIIICMVSRCKVRLRKAISLV